jgi:5'-deoxynucleotidase YfbR-like HD superfamily hydrolase
MLHDWAEARVGDLPKTAGKYFEAETRKRAEIAAFADVIHGLGPSENLYRELYHEYEERQTLESRVVKAADVIDLLVQVLALERAGVRGLDEFWTVAKEGDFGLDEPAKQLVNRVFQELLDARTST